MSPEDFRTALEENTRVTREVSEKLTKLSDWIESDDPQRPGVKVRLDRLENGFTFIKWALGAVAAGLLAGLGNLLLGGWMKK